MELYKKIILGVMFAGLLSLGYYNCQQKQKEISTQKKIVHGNVQATLDSMNTLLMMFSLGDSAYEKLSSDQKDSLSYVVIDYKKDFYSGVSAMDSLQNLQSKTIIGFFQDGPMISASSYYRWQLQDMQIASDKWLVELITDSVYYSSKYSSL